MLFNSRDFFIFFPVVTGLYFLLPHQFRWLLLLTASCVFYMFFIPVYILILFATILVDYYAAIWMEDSKGRRRKIYLIGSIISTCLILFVFKYFNFFNANIASISSFLHWNYSIKALQIILPIGLSFHTFQSLSYVIEVYRGNQKAERHLGIYSLYVMFYPQLVAGPIERPQNLLHQFREKHLFDPQKVSYGLKLMAWGLFKKVVIADRLSVLVDQVYSYPQDYSGIPLILATVFFVFQIYCDFSGYSDIAIGAAKVMGFDLMKNFNYPFRSKNITEFWRRWHISLSTWFTDYIYMPIVTNRRNWGKFAVVFALFVTFTISGLWHGAGWNFIVYGCMHGIALIFEFYTKKTRKKISKLLPAYLYSKISIIITISYVGISWIFFRATTIADAMYILRNIFSNFYGQIVDIIRNNDFQRFELLYFGQEKSVFFMALLSIFIMESIHYLNTQIKIIPFLTTLIFPVRCIVYWGIIFIIINFGVFSKSNFIYFQF